MSNLRTMTTREAAAVLAVTPRTVARWVEDGSIVPTSTFPLGTSREAYLFDAEQVEALAAERAAEVTR